MPDEAWVDPRVRRTRQMLRESLEHLLESRSIEQISVADIAEQASLNRATFYDHYTDKFVLLKDIIESRFQELMSSSGVAFDGSCPTALRAIALATCNHLAGLPGNDCPSRRQIERHYESAVIEVIRGMILVGLKNHPPAGSIPLELIAATVGGAMYNGAREWVGTPDRIPAEQVVEYIYALIGPMLEPKPRAMIEG